MNDKLRYIVEDYFSKRFERDENVSSLATFRGIWEETRAETLRKNIFVENIRPIKQIADIIPKMNIFEIFHNDYPVILVLNDDEILWLDDHASNQDFSRMLQIERLFEQSNEHDASKIAAIILKLRFNYVGYTVLAGNSDDIPTETTMKSRQLRREFNQAISKVKKEITPPVWYQNTEQSGVEYIFWTRAWGDLIKVRCTWDGQQFTFTDRVLAHSIGDYFPPR